MGIVQKRSALITLLSLLWVFGIPPQFACCKPLLLTAAQGRIPLIGYMEVLKDEGGTLSIQDIVSSEYKNKFLPVQGVLSAGFIKHGAVWIRFVVTRPADSPSAWILEVAPAFNERLQLYVPTGNNNFDVRTGGTFQPFSKREDSYRLDHYKINVPPDQSQTYYVKVVSSRTIVINPVFWQADFLNKMVLREAVAHGIYCGVVLLTIIISLLYWIRLRDSLYFYYTLYVLSLTYNFLDSYGYAHQLFWMDVTAPQNIAIRINNLLLLTFNAVLLSKMLDLRNRLPRFDTVYRTFCYLCTGIGSALALSGFYDQIKIPILKLLLLAICINIIVCIKLIRHVSETGLYLSAFGALLLAAFYNILALIGIVPYNVFTPHFMLAGTFIHIIVFNIAVLNQVVRARQEKYSLETALSQEHQTVTNQRQFLRLVSHELRTPLAIIDSTAQIIPLISEDKDQVMLNTEAIRTATRRLSSLLNRCLTHDRLVTGGVLPDYISADICDLIRSTVSHVQMTTQKHQIICDMADSPIIFSCDPMLIELLIGILLDNAVKYSPNGGNISLRVLLHGTGQLSIDISDCGAGMTNEQIDRAFDPYYRGNAISGVGGLGLGLHLARHIAELHSGSISCVSTLSQGSTFTVHLQQNIL